jgi:hypothetical protein
MCRSGKSPTPTSMTVELYTTQGAKGCQALCLKLPQSWIAVNWGGVVLFRWSLEQIPLWNFLYDNRVAKQEGRPRMFMHTSFPLTLQLWAGHTSWRRCCWQDISGHAILRGLTTVAHLFAACCVLLPVKSGRGLTAWEENATPNTVGMQAAVCFPAETTLPWLNISKPNVRNPEKGLLRGAQT